MWSLATLDTNNFDFAYKVRQINKEVILYPFSFFLRILVYVHLEMHFFHVSGTSSKVTAQ